MIVWLASYPRSGNTLVRMIIHKRFGARTYSLYADANDIARSHTLRDLTGHANLLPITPASLELKRASEKTYFIKTHELPFRSTCLEDKVIYIARDGRDAICSYHRYLRDFIGRFYLLDDIILGQVLFGPWGDHVLAWWNARKANHLFLKYEDYLADPAQFIGQIREFVELPDTGKDLPGFDSLKAADSDFLSQGVAGAWVDQLSPQQHDLFLSVHGDALQVLGYLDESEAKPSTSLSAAPIRQCLEALRLSAISKDHAIAALSQRLKAAEAVVQSLHSSTFWRLIAPLRWLRRRLRTMRATTESSNRAS